jgi:hypothetical protein
VRFKGVAYRLVGIDTPERGDKAPRDVNADALKLPPRACAPSLAGVMPGSFGCVLQPPKTGGHANCNFGRLCGSLLIGGRDVGTILISEGLAHPYGVRRHELPAAPSVVLTSFSYSNDGRHGDQAAAIWYAAFSDKAQELSRGEVMRTSGLLRGCPLLHSSALQHLLRFSYRSLPR